MTGLKQRQLGQTAVLVTELGFGGASAGNLYRSPRTRRPGGGRPRLGRGVRYFDTAPHYGLGLSERGSARRCGTGRGTCS